MSEGEIKEDQTIANLEAMYYPAPEKWIIKKGEPVQSVKTKTDRHGKEYEIVVDTDIPRPIWANSVINNLIDSSTVINIGFEDREGKVRTVNVCNSALYGTSAHPEIVKLMKQDAPVARINFNTFQEMFLQYDNKTKKLEYERGVDQFGWFGKDLTFVLTEAIGQDKDVKQLQNAENLQPYIPKGKFEKWREMFIKAVIDHKDGPALFATSLALSSLLKGVLKSDFEFIPALLIYGESGKGKTTIQQLIASMFGRAGLQSKKEGVMLSFNTTLNALQSRMSALGPIPCIVDEKSLENETQGRKMILDEILYTINTGIKDRLDSHSRVVDDTRRVECSLILSGESAEDLSGNTGKQYRLVQQKWEGFKGESDGSLASSIKDTVMKHSGYFIKVFIRHIISRYNSLEADYEECEAHAVHLLQQAEIPDFSLVRITPNLARARLTCKLILACLVKDSKLIEDCLAAFDKTAVEIYRNNIIRPEKERIPEKLAEGIVANINRFSVPAPKLVNGVQAKKYRDPENGEIWGRIFNDTQVSVLGRYLTKLVDNEFSASQIRETIKNLGGAKKGIKVSGVTTYMWCFELPEGVLK